MDEDQLNQQSSDQLFDASNQQGNEESAAINVAKKTAKKAGKATVRAVAALLKAILLNPGFWVAVGMILLGALLVFVIIALGEALLSFITGVNSDGGLTSKMGATGQHFYGARLYYEDSQMASQVIELDYKKYVANIIINIDENNDKITSNLTIPANIDYSTELDEKITNAVDGMIPLVCEQAGLSKMEALELIPNFGFTMEQKQSVDAYLKDYFSVNKSDIFIVAVGETIDIDALVEQYLQSLTIQNCYMCVASPKLFVKDIILSDKNSLTINPKKYAKAVYMPQMDINLKEVEWGFNVPEGNIVAQVKQKNGEDVTNLSEQYVVDSSYIKDGACEKTVEVKRDFTALKFTAIDQSDLKFLEGENAFSLVVQNAYNKKDSGEEAIEYLQTFFVFTPVASGDFAQLTDEPNQENYYYVEFSDVLSEFAFVDIYTELYD